MNKRYQVVPAISGYVGDLHFSRFDARLTAVLFAIAFLLKKSEPHRGDRLHICVDRQYLNVVTLVFDHHHIGFSIGINVPAGEVAVRAVLDLCFIGELLLECLRCSVRGGAVYKCEFFAVEKEDTFFGVAR